MHAELTKAILSEWIGSVNEQLEDCILQSELISSGSVEAALFVWDWIGSLLDEMVDRPRMKLEESVRNLDVKTCNMGTHEEQWLLEEMIELEPDEQQIAEFQRLLCSVERRLFGIHVSASELLVRECDKGGIDPTYVDVSCRYARQIFLKEDYRKKKRTYLPLWRWPDFLEKDLLDLPTDIRKAVVMGSAAVNRLRLRGGNQAASAMVRTVELSPAQLDCIFDVSREQLKAMVSSGRLRIEVVTVRRWKVREDDLPENWRRILPAPRVNSE